jgi:hypothetical protein
MTITADANYTIAGGDGRWELLAAKPVAVEKPREVSGGLAVTTNGVQCLDVVVRPGEQKALKLRGHIDLGDGRPKPFYGLFEAYLIDTKTKDTVARRTMHEQPWTVSRTVKQNPVEFCLRLTPGGPQDNKDDKANPLRWQVYVP